MMPMVETVAQATDKRPAKVLIGSEMIIYLGFYLFHNRFDLLPALPRFLDKIQTSSLLPVMESGINPLVSFSRIFDNNEEIELFFIYLFLKLRMDLGYVQKGLSHCVEARLDTGYSPSGALQANSSIHEKYIEDSYIMDMLADGLMELLPLLGRALFIKLIVDSDKVIELIRSLYHFSASGENLPALEVLSRYLAIVENYPTSAVQYGYLTGSNNLLATEVAST